jgi:hypothetical protein
MIVKANRVAALTSWSQYPRTYAAIVAQIPAALWEQLTSRQLAMVIDTMQSAHHQGRRRERLDTLAEGAIWSETRGMIEFERSESGNARTA